jgi:hypothetical protein
VSCAISQGTPASGGGDLAEEAASQPWPIRPPPASAALDRTQDAGHATRDPIRDAVCAGTQERYRLAADLLRARQAGTIVDRPSTDASCAPAQRSGPTPTTRPTLLRHQLTAAGGCPQVPHQPQRDRRPCSAERSEGSFDAQSEPKLCGWAKHHSTGSFLTSTPGSFLASVKALETPVCFTASLGRSVGDFGVLILLLPIC